jgi:hypothetical protein
VSWVLVSSPLLTMPLVVLDQSPTPMVSFNLVTFYKLVSIYSHIKVRVSQFNP